MSAPTFVRPVHWSAAAIRQLRDATLCPVCNRRLELGVCSHCGADLRGDAGIEVWESASAAAEALDALQSTVSRIPVRTAARADARPAESAAPRIAPLSPPRTVPPTPPRASTTLQSVLAVAGAGLVATAALVFTFLNPDLTDPIARGTVLVIAALLFFGAAPVLMRRALRVSAECVASLGLVFVALAMTVLSPVLASSTGPWEVTTLAALIGGAIALGLGLVTRIRSWMLTGSIALALVPLLAATALGGQTASLWGPLGTAAAALALLDGAAALERRRASSLRLERGWLVAVQVVGFIVLAVAAFRALIDTTPPWLALAAALLGAGAVAARSARHAPRRLWSFAAGASLPSALAIASFALDASTIGGDSGRIVLIPTAAVVGLLLIGTAASARRATHRGSVLVGAMSVVAVSTVPHIGLASLGALGALVNAEWLSEATLDGDSGVAVVLGLLVVSLGLALHGRILALRAGRATRATAVLRASAFWLLGLAGLGALGVTVADPAARSIAAIALVTVTAVTLTGTPLGRRSAVADRVPIVLGAHLALLIAVSLSWQSVELAVTLGAAALVSLAALARTVPVIVRLAHLALGYSYALVLIAAALSLVVIDGVSIDAVAQLSLTATAGLLGAIAATFVRRISAARWITILIVAAVPFAIAVALVVVERSGWVALSTSTMVVLAVSLLLTRRPGLGVVIRTAAGALIVPSIAVVLVNLGAQLLVTSGSPVVLPAIALVAAATLPAISHIVTALHGRGMPHDHARAVGHAIESSTLLTAAIAVLLCFTRDAAGASTALIVFAVLAIGAAATAIVRRIPAYWPLAGAMATAALWSLWAVLGVSSPEAHVLPPALGVAIVAAVLTARGTPLPRLYGGALLAAIIPLLGVLAFSPDASPVRAASLVTASVGLTALGASIHTLRFAGGHGLAALRTPTLVAAIVAGLAGAIQAARIGLDVDVLDSTWSIVVIVMAVALSGAVAAAVAGLLVTTGRSPDARRWSLVPALTAFTAATWTAIEVDELTVAVIWSLMVVLLIVMVVAVALERRGPTVLPRAWVLFALALATAIVAWSTREFLRVEAFSLPLGVMLLAAGSLALRYPSSVTTAPLHHWPTGRKGSWPLLGPGIVVLVFASMLATATDPQTWRAVLVMAIALVAILVGVRWRLAAPFVLGLLVLPIENVLAFSVQIGRGIAAMPWWITLAVVGLVLLVIAVGSERREGDGGSPTARLRDLR